MSEHRATCFCGRRSVYRYGLTDEADNSHTWGFCGERRPAIVEGWQNNEHELAMKEPAGGIGAVDVERRSLEDRIDLLEARSDALESEAVELWERAEKAEAAIKRVRAYLDARDEGLSDEARAEGHFVLVDTDSVRRALNGDNDD